MLINVKEREDLQSLLQIIKLQDRNADSSLDKAVKIEQIFAYLEVIHAELRKMSKKRKLTIIDCGAGNCYLSYLVYYYYTKIEGREIEIHCVDTNKKLMDGNRILADEINFKGMFFHTADLLDYSPDSNVDMVYCLHACDTATDKTIYLGIKYNARAILSVSCCQHSLKLKTKTLKAITRYKSFRDKTLMMVADTLRALLLESRQYKVEVFDFVSSRYTEKNTMIRGVRSGNISKTNIEQEYRVLSEEFRIRPHLEELLAE